jgi:putative adhesin
VLLALASAVAMTAAQQIDTTLAVTPGQRLQVNAYGGEVTVKAWNRNAVQVQATTSGGHRIQVSLSGPVVTVRTEGRHGPPTEAELRISAPPWMALSVSGVHTNVNVDGSRAPVAVETVEGEVKVNGGDGLISLRSVQGSVTLRGAKGRIKVNSVNENLEVTNSRGEIMAETVNGEIVLGRVDAAAVDASTINGDISYDGPIRNGGRYSLATHNGDITLTVAEASSASVAVSTFNGEFESEFAVPLSGTRKGKGFSFTLGSGSAQVNLESFQGTIRLVRPGSMDRGGGDRRHRDHDD